MLSVQGLCSKHLNRWLSYGSTEKRPRAKTKKGEARALFEKLVADFLARPNRRHGSGKCIIWPFARNKGYANISIGGKHGAVCKLILERIDPCILLGYFSAHSCNNGAGGCVNPWHLRWATPMENSRDRVLDGNSGKGKKRTRNEKL